MTFMKYLSKTLMILALFICANVSAEEYTLSIQPILSKAAVIKSYQPLADYLSKQTGQKIKIKAYRNYFTYWQKMKNMEDFDFVLDAAHFTDYRIHNKNYSVLAKLPNTVSYSLVTNDDTLIFDKDELVLKKVATTTSPGLGGIRLYEMFQNPTRLPIQVTVNDSSEAVNAIAEGKAVAAIIPTPLVNNYDFLNTVTTTTSIPHMAFSASPNVPENIKHDVQRALLNAAYSTAGQKMLRQMKLEGFQATNAKEYDGYAKLLKGLFGYTPPEKLISQYSN
jgi:phosphonate transport system substrate-binding protein